MASSCYSADRDATVTKIPYVGVHSDQLGGFMNRAFARTDGDRATSPRMPIAAGFPPRTVPARGALDQGAGMGRATGPPGTYRCHSAPRAPQQRI
jgi:hypothetical protein